MKSFLKKTSIILIIFFLLLGLTLYIGIKLPKEIYKQKAVKTPDFLLINCNIVDVISGKIIPNRQILVQNGVIKAIDSLLINVPPEISIIDVKGKYLMPSLWDMHIHTLSLSPQLHFPLLIANGVTGVRDMGDGDSWISDIDDVSTRDKAKWEKLENDEELLLPKIIQSTSYHLEDIEDINKDNFKQKITELITKLKVRNEPFIKVQLEESELPDYMFYELQYQAKAQGISTLGHMPPNLEINKVVNNGFKSIEHAWALIPYFVKEKKKLDKDIEKKSFEFNNQDSTLTQQVLLNIAKKDSYYVPTHVSSNRKEYLAFEPDFNNNQNNIYTENTQLFLWKTLNWLHTKGYDKKTDLPILKKYYLRGLEITRLANESGVKILAGTDALDRNVYYGISLHDELNEMVKAGLSNAAALKIATYNAADYYGLTNDYGSIEVGKKADFILLKQNPLDNIRNTKYIHSVYYNLRWYNTKDLKEMKNFVKKQAKSFGISCKFIWNMIKQH